MTTGWTPRIPTPPRADSGDLYFGGMAFDEENWRLWIIDVWEDQLYALNPATGAVLRQLAVEDFACNGAAWDGTYLWLPQNAGDFGPGTPAPRIYQVDPSIGGDDTDGAILASHSMTTGTWSPPNDTPADITWDGTNLWAAEVDGSIYKVNPADGTVLAVLELPSIYNQITGIAWDGTHLRVLDDNQNLILRVDPTTGAVVDDIIIYSAWSYRGLHWDGTHLVTVTNMNSATNYAVWYNASDGARNRWVIFNGRDVGGRAISAPSSVVTVGSHLLVSDSVQDKIHMVDPDTGTVLYTFKAPSTICVGMTFDGTDLWTVDQGTDMLYRVRYTGRVITSIPGPGYNAADAAFDGTNLWVSGTYERKVWKVSRADGTVLDEYAAPAGHDIGAIAWDGDHLRIYDIDAGAHSVITVDPTGTVIDTAPIPEDLAGVWPGNGIETRGGALLAYLIGEDGAFIREYRVPCEFLSAVLDDEPKGLWLAEDWNVATHSIPDRLGPEPLVLDGPSSPGQGRYFGVPSADNWAYGSIDVKPFFILGFPGQYKTPVVGSEIIAFFRIQNPNVATPVNITPPVGWTSLGRTTMTNVMGGANAITWEVFHHVVTSSDTPSMTVTFTLDVSTNTVYLASVFRTDEVGWNVVDVDLQQFNGASAARNAVSTPADRHSMVMVLDWPVYRFPSNYSGGWPGGFNGWSWSGSRPNIDWGGGSAFYYGYYDDDDSPVQESPFYAYRIGSPFAWDLWEGEDRGATGLVYEPTPPAQAGYYTSDVQPLVGFQVVWAGPTAEDYNPTIVEAKPFCDDCEGFDSLRPGQGVWGNVLEFPLDARDAYYVPGSGGVRTYTWEAIMKGGHAWEPDSYAEAGPLFVVPGDYYYQGEHAGHVHALAYSGMPLDWETSGKCWYHIVAVQEGTDLGKLYVNGVLRDGSKRLTPSMQTGFRFSKATLIFMQAIYDHALTAEQVASHYLNFCTQLCDENNWYGEQLRSAAFGGTGEIVRVPPPHRRGG